MSEIEVVLCPCGSPASTEIQVGWDPDRNNGHGGGVYVPLCDHCYDQTDEARYHQEAYAELVQQVHYGEYTQKFVYDRWIWKCGASSMSDEDYRRISTDPYGIHEENS